MFQHFEVRKEEEGTVKDIENVCPVARSDPLCLVLVVVESEN